MKLTNKHILTISVVLYLFLLGNNALETKKEVSMMEFMNSFYSSDKKAQTIVDKTLEQSKGKKEVKSELHKKKKTHKFKLRSRKSKHHDFRFKTHDDEGNCTVETYSQKLRMNGTNSTNYEKASPGIYIEGDLFISSAAFRNKERFPPVVLPNGTQVEIDVDNEMFRVNNQNCEEKSCKLNFWFRLASDLHLYYASTKQDLNVLGSVSIKNIVKVSDPLSPIITQCGEAYCFELEDTVNSNWKLCAKSWKRAMRWICAIKKELDIDDASCDLDNKEKIKIIEKRIKEPIIIIPLPSRHCNEGWNYQKLGEDWECECKEGHEQSPIDLPPKEEAVQSPVRPLFSYTEVQARSQYTTVDKELEIDKPIKIKIFEGTLRIMHQNFGKLTTIDGAVYFAEEIVFHTPAEHTIDGKTYDMEVQVIHYGQSKGDISKQVVLSFLIEQKAGVYNEFFDDIDIFNLPDVINKEKEINSNLYIPKLFFRSDENEAPMMKPFSFYTYQGSLTAPPCSERTIIYVASKPLQLSTTTIQLFKEALRVPDLVDQKGNVIVSDWIPQANRKIQERNGRPVFFYDHVKYCGPDPVPKKTKPSGHYEKVIQKASNYFYVNGEKPSGLPGSFVVSEKEAKGLDSEDDE